MLKTILAVGPTASIEVEKEEQDGEKIQVDGNEKELAKKNCKGQPKSQNS